MNNSDYFIITSVCEWDMVGSKHEHFILELDALEAGNMGKV